MGTNKNKLVLAFLLIGFAFTSCKDVNETKEEDFTIMAYYVPEKEYHPEKLPLEKLTHIIFSFTNVIDGAMKFRNPTNAKKLNELVAQKKQHPNLKVMIACGGWGAKGFSDMASSQENRQKFITSTIAFVEKYKLDGVDIDWEYPGIAAAGTKASPEDKKNFTLLMKSLREQLDKLERPQTLTFAAAGWKPYYKNIEINEVMKYADYINVMTYDQVGGGSEFTGHHTALGWIKAKNLLNTPAGDYLESKKEELAQQGIEFEPASTEMIVDYCLKEGIKAKQIVIGAAFYGRSWKGVAPENNGLYQANKGVHQGWGTYHNIRAKYENKNGYKRYWDSIAKAPYLYNAKDSIFFSYDDPESVSLKTSYALKNKLGGIMFWELGNDTKSKNSLVDAIYNTAHK